VPGDHSSANITTSSSAATGQLHDIATQRGILTTWEDRVEGPKHAQQWVSDVTRTLFPSLHAVLYLK
jgi:hypothetical protein